MCQICATLAVTRSHLLAFTGGLEKGKRNVLPGNATLRGDARALTPETNRTIEARMRQIVDGVCIAHGVIADVSYETVFPAVINASALVQAAARAASAVANPAQGDADCEPRLFSEGFAHMAAVRPGCFILMGNGTRGTHAQPFHSADYDFNDEALTIGASFWVQLAEQRLGAGASPGD